MNKKSIFFLSFIMGVAAGSIGTWYCVKKKYEELAQEEIDSVKEVFSKREKELKGEEVTKNIAENMRAEEPAKAMSIKEYASFLQKQGYTNYSDMNGDEDEDDALTKSVKPYVIPPEQFGEIEEYEQIELTYYADQILADENDEIVEDVEETIGFESLSHFGEYEDDSVFVRNDERRCDYQILLDQRLYSDVAVHMPHQMEA